MFPCVECICVHILPSGNKGLCLIPVALCAPDVSGRNLLMILDFKELTVYVRRFSSKNSRTPQSNCTKDFICGIKISDK